MRLPKKIRSELKRLSDTGVPWDVIEGKKHLQFRVRGRLAGVISKSNANSDQGHTTKNIVAQIRRAATGAST